MAKILIIDDDNMICQTLSRMIERMGHSVDCQYTLEEGLEGALSSSYDVILVDVRMPDGNGLDILPKIRSKALPPEVIIITGNTDPDGAELAMKNGAWDYIEKSSSVKNMMLPIMRALDYRDQKKATKSLVFLKRTGIIGESPQLKSCLDLVLKAASTDASILISGETGTGKELFARVIHENSSRSRMPFVIVDCASLPPTVAESILFGHEKGSFTGAERKRMGLIKQADGGTLFLDEIGELSLALQKTFLRVLQERRFRPIGSKEELTSDFRLVAATNRNLEEMVETGRFRRDLLYRLRTFTLDLPSLRSRPSDIKDLALHYIAKLSEKHGMGAKGFSPEFMDALMAYDWPGNVREFINAIERAVLVAADEPTLYPKHLPTQMRIDLARSSVRKDDLTASKTPEIYIPSAKDQGLGKFPKLKTYRKIAATEAEKKYLKDLIDFTEGDLKQVCKVSGLSRSRLYELLKKHHLPSRLHGQPEF